MLLCSIAETLTRLPQTAANIPAAILFAAAAIFYVGVEGSWFRHEAKRSRGVGMAWAVASLLMSAIALAALIVLFRGV